MAHEGVRRFRRRPSAWRVDLQIALAGVLPASVARTLDASYGIPLFILSATTTVLTVRTASDCLRGVRPEVRPAYYLLGTAFSWLAVVTLTRALIVLLSDPDALDVSRRLAEVVFFFGGSMGLVSVVIGIILAVGQRQEVEMLDVQDVLRQQATTDSLTGLANRRRFFELAEAQIAGRRKEALSVVMFDIDRFKTINDNFGHDLGDLVLRRVARCLAQTFSPNHALGRIGGEEFVALVSAPPPDVEPLVLSAMSAVAREARRDILRRPVTLSAGVAALGTEGLDAALRLVDQRLYAAKRSGRNRVVSRGDSRPPSPRGPVRTIDRQPDDATPRGG